VEWTNGSLLFRGHPVESTVIIILLGCLLFADCFDFLQGLQTSPVSRIQFILLKAGTSHNKLSSSQMDALVAAKALFAFSWC